MPQPVRRRDALSAVLAAGLWLPVARSQTAAEGAALPPRANDRLVFAFGEREGAAVTPADLVVDAPQILAYPMDPVTGVVRNATRLNQILLVRLQGARLAAETRARSAGGIVGYSAVCTHTGCDISDWDGGTRRFQCPCHDSQFDPADGARVVGGPAPRQLPALPLDLRDGMLVVAGAFEGRVGFQQPGADPFGF